jgi:mono/diheme cytochrome c family protein
MKTLFKILGVLVVVLILLAAGAYAWASMTASRRLAETHQVHTVDFPVPFPLTEAEASTVPEADRARVAMERAVARGEHLVQARYACRECHGSNYGGGTMVDAFPIGTILGPNITTGQGSRTVSYTPADWDHIVRHGILPDGRGAAMPSEEFQMMSDQELSDIVAYIRSMPAVDNHVPPPTLGPLGKFLMASGQMVLSVDRIPEHNAPHPVTPPTASTTAEFGKHLSGTCIGCHRENLAGGPIIGGDPAWPPARNLTPHAEGLASWTYENFIQLMRNATRPDGTPIKPPMTLVVPYAERMTDTELEALWAYLRTVPPAPTNQ